MQNRLALSTLALSVASLLALAACGGTVSQGGDNGGNGGTGATPDPDTSSSSTGEPTSGPGGTGGTGGAGGAGGTGGAGGIGGSGGSGGVPDDFGPPNCDQNLSLDDADPYNAAKAIELCKKSNGAQDWGVIDAKWVVSDGSPIPAGSEVNYALGHGILDDYGPNVAVRKGDRLLAMSSGIARRPTDPDYQPPSGGFVKGYGHAAPEGFPKASPACNGIVSGPAYDGAALEVSIRTPNIATAFSFDFNYYTVEFPYYTCSSFNDTFVAMLSPTPLGQTDGNISFDGFGNVISVNNVFLDVCGCQGGPPCIAGGMSYACSLGTDGLVGTGYDAQNGGGATGWLTTTAPVTPGSVITLRWTVHDSGDSIFDSATLIDNFRWTTVPNSAVNTSRPME